MLLFIIYLSGTYPYYLPTYFQVRVGLSPSTGSRDLTAQEILFVLEQMAKDDFEEDSCFGCAVLSHASENEAILGLGNCLGFRL